MLAEYTELITSQHKAQPNFKAVVEMLTQYAVDTQDFILAVGSNFDVDTAEGVQLDIIGLRVGVSRVLNFQPTGDISSVLIDDDYRTLIKAKIISNHWRGTVVELYDMWNSLFAPRLQLIVQDNQDMSMTAIVVGDMTALEEQLLTNGYIIPKPVGVTFAIGSGDNYPIFAFDIDVADRYQGWDYGKWFTTL